MNFFPNFTWKIIIGILKPKVKKLIIVSVTSDLVTDNRVHKVCSTLVKMGFQIILVGRELPNGLKLEDRIYSTRRFRLLFTKGPLFYACFNIRLFLFLLFSKFDVLVSNDLDTLPANFLISRLKNKPLVYDSHEYFTEVPELVNRPGVKRIWELLERMMVPHIRYAITVCQSIAGIYTEKYKVPFQVVRNFPPATNEKKMKLSEGIDNFIIYQGALNVGRGLETAIRSMNYLEGVRLVIAGEGDIRNDLELLVKNEGLSSRVEFPGRLPIQTLSELTPKASVGLSIEDDIGLNYRYALPNKLFDYIQAGVPVLVTKLPEMEAIVQAYGIGEVVSDLNPLNLSEVLKEMIHNTEKRMVWKKNLEVASRELVWENEEITLQNIFKPFL